MQVCVDQRRNFVTVFGAVPGDYGQVARKSSRPKSELCSPRFYVKSLEMLSFVTGRFVSLVED